MSATTTIFRPDQHTVRIGESHQTTTETPKTTRTEIPPHLASRSGTISSQNHHQTHRSHCTRRRKHQKQQKTNISQQDQTPTETAAKTPPLIEGTKLAGDLIEEIMRWIGFQPLWWRVGTCGNGETNQFLKKAFNARTNQLLLLSRWQKRLKGVLKTLEPIEKVTLSIPQEGWIKLNCDGSQNDWVSLAGCGGLLRDSNDKWIKGYSRKIGSCDALHAEMWGMYLGMNLAWRQGITHLHVESDSKVLINMVTKRIKLNGSTPTLVVRIRNFLALSWQVILSHTWREGNRSAYWLENFSYSNSFDIHVLENPLKELQRGLVDSNMDWFSEGIGKKYLKLFHVSHQQDSKISKDQDLWVWKYDVTGIFSVKSVYSVLVSNLGVTVVSPEVSGQVLAKVWKSWVASKVIVLSWQLL
ncbi:hypothetical protein TSUD_50380 [Trifolium subterraneum]|uniref:RNase H type-1 domain-containing protein n=1 Tax=Trifolium subterraneum TaxID=3900 RepID=A0A2Z6LI23_TRISU|nr:hypothetical protein TSUD_50380 [Trifolium subterraneum]